ncbi:Signal transduction histidine kinase [Ruminococcaceae bacterium YAD3003]|nr:Signal transduction histidine kinase [Ruminococcaceae bacterium YAD3003]
MSDKPEQSRLKTKKPSRNKSAIRIPISLHFYAVEIVVIILIVFIINIYIQSIVKNYIANECNQRLDIAVNSTQNFAQAFSSQISVTDERSEENIRAYLVNSVVTSADLSNQASIALYTLDKDTGEYILLWPTAYYSASYANSASNVVSQVIEEHGYEDITNTQTTEIDGNLIYYRTLTIEYKSTRVDDTNLDVNSTPGPTLDDEHKDTVDLNNYYLCVYVNSSSYYSFMAAMTLALIQAALLAILIAGVLSMLMTYPLIFSTQKLSRFAKRISKGDFKPVRGHIVSKELSELGDVMNQMAYRLEESDIEQKTFFQNASHELRTPLMSIQGYAEGLKYGVFEAEEDRDNAIDVIIAETGRLSSLVENLLSISKMDMSRSGNYEVKKQNIDVTKICDTIIDRVRGNFIHEDKAIINDIDIQSIYIYGNENDLIRCLENIFSNCLRYCKNAVSFSCKLDESGSNVVFTISDDGPGIAPEVVDHLFERFSKGADGKHGIGLALAKAIAEEHNGTVNAYNKPEGGACFNVTIPVLFHRDQLTKINNDSTK